MANIELTTSEGNPNLRTTVEQAGGSSRVAGPANQPAPQDRRPDYLREHPELHRTDPWQPIVLSLDGGGIRGLSSLYILQQLMKKIDDEEKRIDGDTGGEEAQVRKPCHYFDFMIGTSTGGLIAVLLGRLRLDVDTCIDMYKQIGTYLFGRWRWWRLTKYDHKRLKTAVKEVLKKNCQEHHPEDSECEGDDLLRQYDFSHLSGTFKNHSCKVGLVAIREGDRKRGEGDKRHLFRSYDHVEAPPEQYNLPDPNELNPGRVQSNPTRIWEACRATSAAPLYFNKMVLGGVRYMDGGVGANNPAEYALNEAQQMVDRGQKITAAMVSVGTGHKKPQSRFRNILHVLNWARKSITDTEDSHIAVKATCSNLKVPYFRFDVKTGLSEMKLDECKKKRAKKSKEGKKGKAREDTNQRSQANGNVNSVVSQASNASKAPLFDSYQPERYEYVTYDRIKDKTLAYCRNRGTGPNNHVDVDGELTKLAQLLVYYKREREEKHPGEWAKFSDHPYTRIAVTQNGD